MRNNLAPTQIEIKAEINKQDLSRTLIARRNEFKSDKEFIKYVTHEVNNKKQKSGRICMEILPDGTVYANSVSPHNKKFLENIEPKIKDLVSAFINKRYLTYSSCEGHDLTFRRYVGLAFADEDSRQYVIDEISNLNIWGVKFNKLDSVINQNVTFTDSKPIEYKEKLQYDLLESNIENEAEVFNISFHKNYTRYYFLELIIYDVTNFDKTFFKTPLKHIRTWIMKKFFWENTTKKLSMLINSSNFTKYKF